jgi:hypothetical protein
MPGQDDLVALLGPANQLGQLCLGIGDGYLHAFPTENDPACTRNLDYQMV